MNEFIFSQVKHIHYSTKKKKKRKFFPRKSHSFSCLFSFLFSPYLRPFCYKSMQEYISKSNNVIRKLHVIYIWLTNNIRQFVVRRGINYGKRRDGGTKMRDGIQTVPSLGTVDSNSAYLIYHNHYLTIILLLSSVYAIIRLQFRWFRGTVQSRSILKLLQSDVNIAFMHFITSQ